MAKKPDGLVVPEGMRWDHCKGKIVPAKDNHVVISVDSGWPDTHVADLPAQHHRRTWG